MGKMCQSNSDKVDMDTNAKIKSHKIMFRDNDQFFKSLLQIMGGGLIKDEFPKKSDTNIIRGV